eukprot:7018825-Pyramimonas_sp.AAC.1
MANDRARGSHDGRKTFEKTPKTAERHSRSLWPAEAARALQLMPRFPERGQPPWASFLRRPAG